MLSAPHTPLVLPITQSVAAVAAVQSLTHSPLVLVLVSHVRPVLQGFASLQAPPNRPAEVMPPAAVEPPAVVVLPPTELAPPLLDGLPPLLEKVPANETWPAVLEGPLLESEPPQPTSHKPATPTISAAELQARSDEMVR